MSVWAYELGAVVDKRGALVSIGGMRYLILAILLSACGEGVSPEPIQVVTMPRPVTASAPDAGTDGGTPNIIAPPCIPGQDPSC